MKSGGYLLGKGDGESGRRGRPPARNTRTPGRGLGWRSSRSVRSTFAQQRSTASTVSGYIDTLLRTCAAKGCDVIGLQETKRDGISEISASGYRVFFSGDCTTVKGRNGQHGVGLAIKKDIVVKPGEDGITIECISARLLKARISIKSNFVTFVVAYAPTEEAPEGQKAKYMSALNCTVASVPLGNTSGREVRVEEKQTAKCWAHMAETSSTKTANYCWVSYKTTSLLF